MNNKIIINGEEVFVETDKGVVKVTGENVAEKLLLENYIEYLETKIEKLTNRLFSENYSNMELKDIIKELWKNDGAFKTDLLLAGMVGGIFPGLVCLAFLPKFLLMGPLLILALADILCICGAVILAAYSEAKRHKKDSIEYKKNIQIAEEQRELIEKELAKIPALVKSDSLSTNIDNKKLPETKRLYNFGDAYYVRSNIITLNDEPVSGALRKLRR